VDEVLLRTLPVRNPEQLVLFNGARNHFGSNSGGNMLSYPMYEDFRDNFVDRNGGAALPRVSQAVQNPAPTPKVFSGMFARRTVAVVVGVNGQAERVPGELVSGTYFPVLGVGAAIGRVITPDDDKVRGDGAVAVLSYDYWKTRFASDPSVVGRRITLQNFPFTIIGVSQQGFNGLDIGYAPGIRVPLMMKARITPNWDDVDNRRSRWVNVRMRTVRRRLPTVVYHEGTKTRKSPPLVELELVNRPPAARAAGLPDRQRLRRVRGEIDVDLRRPTRVGDAPAERSEDIASIQHS
jgi:hypothetical protein